MAETTEDLTFTIIPKILKYHKNTRKKFENVLQFNKLWGKKC